MFFLYTLYFLLGFSIFGFLSAPSFGKPNRMDSLFGYSTSMKFKIGGKFVHLHHWLILAILIIIVNNPYLICILLGGIVQGLTYKDWYKIIY